MSERLKCEGGCGRWLSSPEALARGYGRVCWERLGLQPDSPPGPRRLPRPAARPADAPPEVHPDQTEIPLTHFQPTLESL